MPNINTRFTLAGEKEYKAAISQIGEGMRVLNSEMRKVESEYAKNSDSVEALTKVNDVLERKIYSQVEKIEYLRAALQQSAEKYKEADKRTMAWQTSLNNAEAELNRLNEQVAENNRKIKESSDTYAESNKRIAAEMKVLDAQMNLLNTEYAENADSTDALVEKNNVLNQKILTQISKIELLSEKLQESAKQYGDADARTKEWEAQLYDAEATLNKLNSELDENTGKIEENGKAVEDTEEGHVKLGDAINTVAGKLGINLPEGADKALEALNGIDAGTVASVGAFAALAAGVVKVEKELANMTKEAAEDAKEIKTFASITGQSAQDVQKMEYAAGKLGVSYDRIRDSLKEVTNKMQEAQNGSEDTAKAFDTLDVKIEDGSGHLRNANDVFLDIIDALGNIENQSERDALAMDLMSESAQELNPIIDAGSETLRGYMQAAEDMGVALEDDELGALVKVKDAFYDLEAQQKATKNQIAVEFAPYLASFYEDVTGGIGELGDMMEESGIVQAFGSILESVGELLNPSEELADNIIPDITLALRPLALVLSIVADYIQIINSAIKGLNSGDWSKFKDAINFNHTDDLLNKWDTQDARTASSASSGRSGFGGGVATQSVVNNYYEVSGANVRAVNQIADAAESSRQQNRKFGG